MQKQRKIVKGDQIVIKEKETHAHTWSFTHFTHRVAEDSDLSTETMEPKSSKATFHNEERRRKSKTKSRNV